jgi:hypothetical protein
MKIVAFSIGRGKEEIAKDEEGDEYHEGFRTEYWLGP